MKAELFEVDSRADDLGLSKGRAEQLNVWFADDACSFMVARMSFTVPPDIFRTRADSLRLVGSSSGWLASDAMS